MQLPGTLAQALCKAPVTWLAATQDASRAYPFLVPSAALFNARGSLLWRFTTSDPQVAQALGCAGKPNGG